MTSLILDSGPPERTSAAVAKPELVGLLVLVVFTLLATGGYGYFALHTENLPASEPTLRFYTISFQFFAQLHILIAFVALGIVLVRRSGARWIPGLVAVYLLSFTAEHIGTGYGIPFGGYGYTGLLGARLGPRVPLLIPLSWFLMALPCWVLARAAFPGRLMTRLGLGALGLVLWDLALDPAMSALTPYWRWEETGPYYGMPWMNLAGWFVTGLVLMSALERFGGNSLGDTLPVRWMAAFYAVVAALPLGMLCAAGEWLAVVVTLMAMTLVAVAVWIVRGQTRDAPVFATNSAVEVS